MTFQIVDVDVRSANSVNEARSLVRVAFTSFDRYLDHVVRHDLGDGMHSKVQCEGRFSIAAGRGRRSERSLKANSISSISEHVDEGVDFVQLEQLWHGGNPSSVKLEAHWMFFLAKPVSRLSIRLFSFPSLVASLDAALETVERLQEVATVVSAYVGAVDRNGENPYEDAAGVDSVWSLELPQPFRGLGWLTAWGEDAEAHRWDDSFLLEEGLRLWRQPSGLKLAAVGVDSDTWSAGRLTKAGMEWAARCSEA